MTRYTYDLEGNMTSLTDISGRTEQMSYDAGGRLLNHTSNGGNKINYDYDTLNSLVEKSYEDTRDPEGKEGVLYGYDALGQRVSMMDRSGESTYEYDGLGRITKVTTGSGEVTSYKYDGCDQLESITYPDGKKVSYKYDKNDNLTEVTDRTGAKTTYVYDQINRIIEIHRPNGVSTYNTYNARDQITDMKNLCEDCEWTISEYHYTYDDRGFITAEDAIESLYGYAWDDKHDGKHENWHDTLYPHGDKHYNKHDKDGLYGFQIIETKRAFEYDDDGKLLSATENEDRQGRYDYTFRYDDMGNRTFYAKSRNGKVQESAEYTYNSANQPTKVREYDGKHYKNVEYTYDADGNRILEEEVKPDGTRKVEKSYEYTVENRLKAVSDKNDLLAAMAYDGDGNRIFQLNYNLHTDDDWKGNSGNGNGNNKDNPGSGNSGNNSGNGTGSKAKAASEETAVTAETEGTEPGFWDSIVSFFTGDKEEETEATETEAATSSSARSSNKDKDKGNNGNDKNNGVGNGNGNSGNNGNSNKPDKPDKPNKPNDNTSTGGTNDNNGNANGNTNNTGGSQNQSGILFPIDGEVSELEGELIGMIKTTGKHKNYELVEYVNDVNREHTEVLMELNINGIMDTAYSYGDQRLTNERFTEWTGYYTYDPRGSVTGVTDEEGMIWQSYRYDAFGSMTFGQPQYNNVYSYNAESYNPNVDAQYLRARYYSPTTADFISEDSYLGDITDPLTLNRYNYVNSSPLNYVDPSGHFNAKVMMGSGENLAQWLPDEYQVSMMGDAYDDWSERYTNAPSDLNRWALILEMQTTVNSNADELYGKSSYDELVKLFDKATVQGQIEECGDMLNKVSQMGEEQFGGFILGVLRSLRNNFNVIPDAISLLISNSLGYESQLERDLRNEQYLIENYNIEEGYLLGREFGDLISLLGAAGLWSLGGAMKSGSIGIAVDTGGGSAGLSAVGVVAGEMIQLWAVIVGTATLTNSIISEFNNGGSSNNKGDSETGGSEYKDALDSLSDNNKHHILQEKHSWDKVVDNPNSWDEVSDVLNQVLENGIETPYGNTKNVFQKVHNINGSDVLVKYLNVNGKLTISDAWVMTR